MKRKTLLLLVLTLALAVCLCGCGGTNDAAQVPADNSTNTSQEHNAPANDTPANDAPITPDTNNEKQEPKPDENQSGGPATPPDQPADDGKLTCTISISCATLLDNMDLCPPDKAELIPADGRVLKATTVEFNAGENVFNVLQRTCKENKIHLEFMNTPLYNSAYIEGLHNLYEFDAGELSGWMYSVNSWFPNFGCSRYELKDGDVINWVYTCDLGEDVGGGGVTGNNNPDQ